MAIIVNKSSQHILNQLVQDWPHALLLSGPEGIGLKTIALEYARQVAETIQVVLPEKNEAVDLEKGTISIELIRRLYSSTRTVEPKGRVVIIDYAERMGLPAQNAFLKLLEEPNETTHFILLSHAPDTLLPTIHSRSQHVALRKVSIDQSESLLDELNVRDITKRTQLIFIANGLPAQLTKLASDETLFEARATIVRDARTYVSGSPYQRLLLAKDYKDRRAEALTLLTDSMEMLKTSLTSSDSPALLRRLNHLETLHQRITEQGNVRLQLSAGVML